MRGRKPLLIGFVYAVSDLIKKESPNEGTETSCSEYKHLAVCPYKKRIPE